MIVKMDIIDQYKNQSQPYQTEYILIHIELIIKLLKKMFVEWN